MLNSSGDWVNQDDFTVLGAVAPTVSPASLSVNQKLLKSEKIKFENVDDFEEHIPESEEFSGNV